MTILTSRAIATAAAAAIALTTMSLTPADAKVRYYRGAFAVPLVTTGSVVIITRPTVVRRTWISPRRAWHRHRHHHHHR
jgi:hypothetical protein